MARKAGEPLTIETINIEVPKAGEVLVEVKATGVCHTDAYTLSEADPESIFLAILGHEGAGIVREVGPGVTTSPRRQRGRRNSRVDVLRPSLIGASGPLSC